MQTILCESARGLLRLGYNRAGNFLALRWPSIVILAILVIVGNGSPARGADFKQGSYSRTSPRGDKVILKFGDKQRFVLSKEDGETLVEGIYKVAKDQIEFTDEKGPFASKDAKPGKYKWQLAGKELSFTKVEDESEGRTKGITGSAWTLEK